MKLRADIPIPPRFRSTKEEEFVFKFSKKNNNKNTI